MEWCVPWGTITGSDEEEDDGVVSAVGHHHSR